MKSKKKIIIFVIKVQSSHSLDDFKFLFLITNFPFFSLLSVHCSLSIQLYFLNSVLNSSRKYLSDLSITFKQENTMECIIRLVCLIIRWRFSLFCCQKCVWLIIFVILKYFQYNSIDNSWLSKHVMHPFWNYCVEVVKTSFLWTQTNHESFLVFSDVACA